MMHAMLARHEALLPLARAIGGQVTLCDLPGHGRSADWDGQTDYHALVTDVIAACCNGPTHIIGHSFSATAALRLAVERPDLVSRLTLIEPVYFAAARGTAEYDGHTADFAPFLAAMEAGDDLTAASLFNGLWGAVPWEAIPDRMKASLARRIHMVIAGGRAIEDDPQGITSETRLSQLNIPVTLIRGGKTRPVIAAIHNALEARIPQSTDHCVAGAGHMLPILPDYLAKVAAIIRAEAPEKHPPPRRPSTNP